MNLSLTDLAIDGGRDFQLVEQVLQGEDAGTKLLGRDRHVVRHRQRPRFPWSERSDRLRNSRQLPQEIDF